MKKYILLLLLFSAVTSQAQISARRDSLGIRACWMIGVPTTGTDILTSAKIVDAINRAVYSTCVDYPAIEKFDTVKIDSAAEYGSLNSDFVALKAVWMIKGDTVRMPVEIIAPDTLKRKQADIRDNLIVEGKDPVVRYCWSVDGKLRISSKWRDGVDTAKFFVEYYAIDTPLTSGSSATSIKKEFREILLYKICENLETMRGNFTEAVEWRKLYGK